MNKRFFLVRTVSWLFGIFFGAEVTKAQMAESQKTPVKTRGIPTARNVDHLGLTVPDLPQAVRFFTDVLGADLLFQFNEGPGTENPADLQKTFNVNPRDRLRVAMLRLGPNLNVELMYYESPDTRREMPKNDEVDVPHLAFFVDDMAAAADYLSANGCTLLDGPFTSKDGPKAGQSIQYLRTPWGMSLEILHRPAHMPYEQGTNARLFGPEAKWTTHD